MKSGTPLRSLALFGAALGLLPPAAGQSQPAAPASAASAARAEEDEAMARARRLAANPMRMIVEASRIRRRDEAAVVPVSTGGGAAVAAEAPTPRSVPVPVPPPPAPVAVGLLNSSIAADRSAVTTVPELAAAPEIVSPLSRSLPAAPALAPEIARPTVVHRVLPAVPPRLLADLPPDTVFIADLTIQPDGSVSAVDPVPPVPRSVQRYVVQALGQWRFEPLPSQRVWRVEVAFRSE